jgi:Calcium-dependent channel, 7TM region, putative phosphate
VLSLLIHCCFDGIYRQEISNIVSNPNISTIINLLATSLPSQSTYFIQILMVSTAITGGMEILRVVPALLAFLRGYIGPKLTQKERDTPAMGLAPLSAPSQFSHADITSTMVRSSFSDCPCKRKSPSRESIHPHLCLFSFEGSLLYGSLGVFGNCSAYKLCRGFLLSLYGCRLPTSVHLHLLHGARLGRQGLAQFYSDFLQLYAHCRGYQ